MLEIPKRESLFVSQLFPLKNSAEIFNSKGDEIHNVSYINAVTRTFTGLKL